MGRNNSGASANGSQRSTGETPESKMASMFGSFQQQMLTSMQTLQGAMQEHVDEKFCALESKIDGAEEKREAAALQQSADLGALAKRVALLETSAAMPELSAQERKTGIDKVQRDPYEMDPTLVRIGASALVARKEMEELVEKLADDIKLDKAHYKLRGGPLSKNYTMAFNGDERTAARRARKLLDSQRGEDGQWATPTITRPDGAEERIFISPDRSWAKTREEIDSKLLLNIVSDMGTTTTRIKRDSSLAWRWQVLVSVVFDAAQNACKLEWDMAVAKEAKVDHEKAEKLFIAARDKRKSRG